MTSLQIPLIKMSQPIGDVYIGSIPSRALWEISEIDRREIRLGEDGIFAFTGIQRRLNLKRVKEIATYVQTSDATFPTAVVLAASSESVIMSDDGNIATIDLSQVANSSKDEVGDDDDFRYEAVVRVIDGQHRIEGLKAAGVEDFDVNIALFLDADMEDQARVFSIVNLAQTPVSKSLVYDLFGYSTSRSPEKTAHDVTVSLDQTENSPFFHRIKRLGSATPGRVEEETLTQANVVEGLLRHLVSSREQLIVDRDIGRRGRKWPEVTPEEARKLVLRPFFVRGQDLEVAELIWNYFTAVATTWPDAWRSAGRGEILGRTNGYRALIRLFRDVYNDIAAPGEVPSEQAFINVFGRTSLEDGRFTTENYAPGTGGESRLYKDLKADLRVGIR